nr:unnamed protein product [Callosobruchus chinensis]
MYKEHAEEKSYLKYLLTYKLSQDHIELFFGAIRSPKQFQAAFRKLIIHSQIRAGDTGNITNLDATSILFCSSCNITRDEDCHDLRNTPESLEYETKIREEMMNSQYLTARSWDLTDYSKDVVGYIAGFVVRQVRKVVTYSKCISLIESDESLSILIQLSNQSFLNIVIDVCKAAEKCFRFIHKTSDIYNKNVSNLLVLLIITNTMCNIPIQVYDDFGDHFYDVDPLRGHTTILIKLILKKYFSLRIHHECMKNLDTKTMRVRSSLTKIIHITNHKEQAIIFNAIEGTKLQDYLLKLGPIVNPKNIVFCSRISNSRICIYLSSKDAVDRFLDAPGETVLQDETIRARRLVTPADRLNFLHIIDQHPDYEQIYTDAAKIEDQLGIATVKPSSAITMRLPDFGTVFTGELYAIMEALKHIKNQNNQKWIIVTDSLNSLLGFVALGSFVPHQWESEGILYWPLSNLNLLRKEACSAPDKSSWRTYKCKVKKENIVGLEEAELWEEEFVNVGTDAENSTIVPFQKTSQGIDQNIPIVLYTEPDDQDQVHSDSIHCASEISTNEVSSVSLSEKLDLLLINQQKILSSQERVLDCMKSEFLQARATYDRVYELLKSKQCTVTDTDALNKEEETLSERFQFPLATVEEVLRFNKDINQDETFKNYLLKRYCAIGGVAGNEEGRAIARKLRHIFFTEHVLTMFSWTGISRTAGLEKKEAFQACEGILDLFKQLIKMGDDRWCDVKNEKFFKFNTLKHARQTEKAVQKKEAKKLPQNDFSEQLQPETVHTELETDDIDKNV